MAGRTSMRAVAVGLAVLFGGASSRADDEGEKTVGAKIREKFPPLNVDKFKDMTLAANKRTAAELAEDKFWLDGAHDLLMKKWKTIQEAREAHRKITQGAALVTGAHTLNLLGLETERKAKVQAVLDRENAEYMRRFGSKARTKEEIRFAVYEWEQTPEYRAYQEEREAVRTWFKDAIQHEVMRAQTGQGRLMDALDEMTTESQDEVAFLARARRVVAREIEKREAGIGPNVPEPPPGPTEEQKDALRRALHFAPVRTEYEGKTGEPVETLFQVWNGRTPYLVYSYAKKSTQTQLQYLHIPDSGYLSVLFTFQKPGAYTGVVHATDQNGSDVKATVTITVTGDPVTPKKVDPKGKDEPPPPGKDDPPSPPPGTPPIPLTGTFHALLFEGTAGVPRHDVVDRAEKVTPVSLEITIDAAGKIRGKAAYALPASAMGKPKKDGAKNLYWKSSFTLEGQVDWTTGQTHLDLRDGLDEAGVEVDTPGYGVWKEWTRVEYSATLDGWSIPSPAGDLWMGAAMPANAAGMPLEKIGRPEFSTRPDGKRVFQGRGFFGDLRGATVPGVATPWAKTIRRALHHYGYVGKEQTEDDETVGTQMAWNMAARMGVTGWYLKLVDAPPPTDPEPPKDEEPKKGELWAFGIWPTRPVQTQVGGKVTARAMGVFSDDPFDATDLSAKATWTSSRPGLVVNERGEITASAPGIYHVTATFTGPDGQPMSSTLTVAVSKE